MSTYKFIYFNARGLGEISRYLFSIADVKFEDYRYPINEKFEHAEFDKDKQTFTYGQIPVLEVDGVQIAQSKAIERFLAKRFGLFGSNDLEAALIDSVGEAVVELRTKYWDTRKVPEPEKAAAIEKYFHETLASYFRYFEAILKKNNTGYLVGSKLSLADVQVWYIFESVPEEQREKYIPSLLKDFPELTKHKEKIGALPGVQKWIAARPKTFI